ncbi:sugar phosphate isomerase/epimerase [Jiangella ureilytica]|uniref:Sugar phosphate isomerase/epimerase n=1 Tax=Jiangella ureilytica TaxID=2530374 RepID=A0A4R4RMS4_9ACTN|nr:sugar phosphate isomerase/epimerase [Jiangella ureilytica]TDC50359.1 sugar phosphate isomerase/epimerase [Jiangella ureilytica]
MTRYSRRRLARALTAAAAALALSSGAVATSPASASADCSVRVPTPAIGFQLFGAREWIADVGLEEVLATLAEIGYKEVQPYAGSYDMPADEFEALLRKYGLKASSGQYRYTDANFGDFLEYAKSIGHRFVGSGGFGQPGIGSYENTLATAAQMNRLGELSVRNGTGRLFGHNHAGEFQTTYPDPDTGELKTAWQILVENTDPRWVTFEVDVFWSETAGVDTAALIEQYGDRIQLLHIKDGVIGTGTAGQTSVGEGTIDWGPILEAAQGRVRYYVVEADRTNWPDGPAVFAEESFDYLSCSGR